MRVTGAGRRCGVERKAFDAVASELKVQYGLEGLADEILVQRVAMYLIRIARAEVYEAQVGVSPTSVLWGEPRDWLLARVQTLDF